MAQGLLDVGGRRWHALGEELRRHRAKVDHVEADVRAEAAQKERSGLAQVAKGAAVLHRAGPVQEQDDLAGRAVVGCMVRGKRVRG